MRDDHNTLLASEAFYVHISCDRNDLQKFKRHSILTPILLRRGVRTLSWAARGSALGIMLTSTTYGAWLRGERRGWVTHWNDRYGRGTLN